MLFEIREVNKSMGVQVEKLIEVRVRDLARQQAIGLFNEAPINTYLSDAYNDVIWLTNLNFG